MAILLKIFLEKFDFFLRDFDIFDGSIGQIYMPTTIFFVLSISVRKV